MRIINIVHDGSKVNMGVWSSALSTAQALKKNYDVDSEIWFPAAGGAVPENPEYRVVPLEATRLDYLQKMVEERNLNPATDLISVHGSWRFPTRWAYALQKQGFSWNYTPHGNLNQYGFAQKRLKKTIYFQFFEKKMVETANMIRAVGRPEKADLEKLFPRHANIALIPNGVPRHVQDLTLKQAEPRIVLFMSRLFRGKGVVPLVEAWLSSSLKDHAGFELLIAGPDQGELSKINRLLDDHPPTNVRYIGPKYDLEKEQLLNRSSFFILPSWSETFSMAVLESMGYGLIPVITPECNFPEVFSHDLGIRITIEAEGIRLGLETIRFMTSQDILEKQFQTSNFVYHNYTLDHIAKLEFNSYRKTASIFS